MTQHAQTGQDQDNDIDLAVIYRRIGGFFRGIITGFFRLLLFIRRNIIFFIGLFILGTVAGYFLDKGTKIYDQKVLVAPNFGSVDYLYAKIDLLNSKIEERDTLFLKSIGIQNPAKLVKIEVKPVIDIYNFVNQKSQAGGANNAQNTQNFELVKLLAENGDINKVIKDDITSRNYGRHMIILKTNGVISYEKTIRLILDFLNNNDYYLKIQQSYISNYNNKIKEDQQMIAQINGIIDQMTNTANSNNTRNDKLVYYNDNNQMNEILSTKNMLIGEIGNLKVELVGVSEVIKEYSRTLNVRDRSGANNKLKFILPLLLIFLVLLGKIILVFSNRQMRKLRA